MHQSASAIFFSFPCATACRPSRGGTWSANVLTLSAITGLAFDAYAVKQGTFTNKPSDLDHVDARDFLICRGSGNLKLVGRAKFPNGSMLDVIFPDTAIAARIDKSLIDPIYLDAVWSSGIVRSQIERLARTTSGTYKVNQQILSAIFLPLPPIFQQRGFAVRVADIQATIAQQERMREASDQLVAALMAQLFDGSSMKSRAA